MNLACDFILFLITAVLVIYYDYKTQFIPIWLILCNYILLWEIFKSEQLFYIPLILGLICIFIYYIKDIPVDSIYIITMCILLIANHNLLNIFCIIPQIIQYILTKVDKMSYMVSIEMSFIILFVINRILI